MNFALLVQIFSCFFMTGVIWLVQVLVYPNFSLVLPSFEKFHEFHTRRITFVVAPAMLLELASGIWLLWVGSQSIYFWNFMSIFLIWILTGFVSVPIHHRIQKNPQKMTVWLTKTNWARTILWSIRSIVWLWFLKGQLPGGNL
jgi:hypothetical protein